MTENDPLIMRMQRILDFHLIKTSPIEHGARGALEMDLRDLMAEAAIEAVESDVRAVPDHRGYIRKRFQVETMHT